MNKIKCPTCNNNGCLISGFINAGELPEESKTCIDCGGLEWINPRFFVEFNFENESIKRKYWLPLYFETNDPKYAKQLCNKVKVDLSKKYSNVEFTKPLPYADISKYKVDIAFKNVEHRRLCYLRVEYIEKNKELKIQEDFTNKYVFPEIHTEYKFENRTCYLITKQFPVRVIKEGQEFKDHEDSLMISLSS